MFLLICIMFNLSKYLNVIHITISIILKIYNVILHIILVIFTITSHNIKIYIKIYEMIQISKVILIITNQFRIYMLILILEQP